MPLIHTGFDLTNLWKRALNLRSRPTVFLFHQYRLLRPLVKASSRQQDDGSGTITEIGRGKTRHRRGRGKLSHNEVIKKKDEFSRSQPQTTNVGILTYYMSIVKGTWLTTSQKFKTKCFPLYTPSRIQTPFHFLGTNFRDILWSLDTCVSQEHIPMGRHIFDTYELTLYLFPTLKKKKKKRTLKKIRVWEWNNSLKLTSIRSKMASWPGVEGPRPGRNLFPKNQEQQIFPHQDDNRRGYLEF